MAVNTIKAEKVVTTALALLERDVVLPATMWRDAAGDFRGAKNDTITVRLPAYAVASKNALRSGAGRSTSNLHERSIDTKLTDRLYFDTLITDEQLTLDILNFSEQVMSPILGALVRSYEDECASLLDSAPYAVELDLNESNPYETFVAARKALNLANVPMSGRTLVYGADVEEHVLNATTFVRDLAASGDASALRDANTGRIAGFNAIVSNAIDPGAAYVYHRTAFMLNSRAPMVPRGAPWGASMSAGGFALRAVQVFDTDIISDKLAVEGWVGKNHVYDHGTIGPNGKFVPSVEPDLDDLTDALFVRAVKINSPASS